MVNKLFSELGKSKAMADFAALIKGIDGIAGLNLPQSVIGLLDNYGDLDYDGLMAAIGDLDIYVGGKPLNEETVLELISGYSFYNSPITYPKIFFLGEGELRDYAYAKYLGTKHGAVVGSVLIGNKVGPVSLDNAGNNPMSIAQLTSLFNRVETEREYMPKYYPYLAVRSAVIKYIGLVPLAILLAYVFAYAEKKQLDKIIRSAAPSQFYGGTNSAGAYQNVKIIENIRPFEYNKILEEAKPFQD
jgi:hypothetical protein